MLFDCPIEAIPNFNKYDDEWWPKLKQWCWERGYYVLWEKEKYRLINMPDQMWIGVGPGPRTLRHAVVMRGNQLWADPHPSDMGLAEIDGGIEFLDLRDELRDTFNAEVKAIGFDSESAPTQEDR